MTATSNGVMTEIQKLYDTAVVAESLKGLFVGIYEYGKAAQKHDNWKKISAAISKSKDAGVKEFNESVDETWKYVDRTIAKLKKMEIPYRARDYLSHAIGDRAEKDIFDPESDHLELACGSLEWFGHCEEPELIAICKEAKIKKKEYKDAVHLFKRTRETSAWYAWDKIYEFLEAYEGDHRLKEKCKGIKSLLIIAMPWEIHASDLDTIMNDRWKIERFLLFKGSPTRAT
jgi:hypothetical protein